MSLFLFFFFYHMLAEVDLIFLVSLFTAELVKKGRIERLFQTGVI